MLKQLFIIISLALTSCTNNVLPLKPKPDLKALNDQSIYIGKPRNAPKVSYPKNALARGQDGWVLLQLDIEANGKVSNVQTVDFSPLAYFLEPTIQYAKHCVFIPIDKRTNNQIVVKNRYFLVEFKSNSSADKHKAAY